MVVPPLPGLGCMGVVVGVVSGSGAETGETSRDRGGEKGETGRDKGDRPRQGRQAET